MDENRTPAVHERRERLSRSDRRSLMLIVSAALQWLLILVCIVYLAVLYKESHQKPTICMEPSHLMTRKEHVITELSPSMTTSPNCTKIKLERTDGLMDVRNGSIVIPSTGFYLLYLEGLTNDDNKIGVIELHIRSGGNDKEKTWKEFSKNGKIRATLLKKLFNKSEIYLTTCTLSFDELHFIVYPV